MIASWRNLPWLGHFVARPHDNAINDRKRLTRHAQSQLFFSRAPPRLVHHPLWTPPGLCSCSRPFHLRHRPSNDEGLWEGTICIPQQLRPGRFGINQWYSRHSGYLRWNHQISTSVRGWGIKINCDKTKLMVQDDRSIPDPPLFYYITVEFVGTFVYLRFTVPWTRVMRLEVCFFVHFICQY